MPEWIYLNIKDKMENTPENREIIYSIVKDLTKLRGDIKFLNFRLQCTKEDLENLANYHNVVYGDLLSHAGLVDEFVYWEKEYNT
jgi:hypothetical protein